MKNEHEKEVCEAIVDFIVNRKNLTIKEIRFPDEEIRNAEAVDILVHCVQTNIIIEHTRIESYPEQIGEDIRVKKLIGPVIKKLDGKMPKPGHYRLCLHVGAVKGVKYKDSTKLQLALEDWIIKKAPTLEIGSPNTAPCHYVKEKPDGVPFEVTLYRWPCRDGRICCSLVCSDDLEQQQIQRIQRALRDKCPKLQDAKNSNNISILVLELNDIFLGNYTWVAKNVIRDLDNRQDIPDDIYLIMTELDSWDVWIIKEEDTEFPNIRDAGPYYLDLSGKERLLRR